MKVLVKTVGGGTFSKFMVAVDAVIREIPNVEGIDSLYIDIDRSRIDKTRQMNLNLNPFDFVLEQSNDNITHTVIARPLNNYTNILENPNYKKLSTVCSKLKIKDVVLDRIDNSITEDTLGAHVRITDMNFMHPEYGKSSTKDYIKKINELTNEKKFKNIFVASDNKKSIELIGNDFDILYNNVNNRSNHEHGGVNYMTYLRKQSGESQFWVDSFVEMISLSRCGELLYKMSNLNNASVLFSNTIKKTHRII